MITARLLLHRMALGAALAMVAAAVAVGGLWARGWAWDQTEPIRFVQDINNAFLQGSRTLSVGYVERYDNNATAPVVPWGAGPMSLDYGPGRLAVATVWSRWVRARVTAPTAGPNPASDPWYAPFYAQAHDLKATAALCRPLLMFNLAGEALAAAAMFLLVRRYADHGGRRPWRGAAVGLVAAGTFWLDPAVITNAHCWPQWDSWVLPFLLWATFAATTGWWFTAGVLVAVGAMFKGQILFCAPFMLLWPLFQGRPGAAGRWACGLAAGAAAVTAVWDVRLPGHLVGRAYQAGHANGHAVAWVVTTAVAFAAVTVAVRVRSQPVARLFARRRKSDEDPRPSVMLPDSDTRVDGAVRVRPAPPDSAVAVTRFPWWAGFGRPLLVLAAAVGVGVPVGQPRVGAVAVAGLALLLWRLPKRWLATVAAGWVAAAVLLCVPLFDGSGQWFAVGIAHGTTARVGMALGPDNNLANLLGSTWNWGLEDPTLTLPAGPTADRVGAFLTGIDRHVRLPPGKPVALPLKYLLVAIWFVLAALCAAGGAVSDRRRSPRFLVAVAAPWVVMFAVLGQMHQRYLLWGSALTCMAVAVSPGLLLLHGLLSVVSAGQELLSMADDRLGGWTRDRAQWQADHADLLSVLHGWTPGMGWAVLLAACVFTYLGAVPGLRRSATPPPGRGLLPFAPGSAGVPLRPGASPTAGVATPAGPGANGPDQVPVDPLE